MLLATRVAIESFVNMAGALGRLCKSAERAVLRGGFSLGRAIAMDPLAGRSPFEKTVRRAAGALDAV